MGAAGSSESFIGEHGVITQKTTISKYLGFFFILILNCFFIFDLETL
jgi:hypothetical protein